MMRYGEMRMIGHFKSALTDLKIRERCVIKTERGTEIGTVVFSAQTDQVPDGDAPSTPTPAPATAPKNGPPKASLAPGGSPKEDITGEVLRRMTPEDIKELGMICNEKVPAEFAFCQQKIKDLKLEMKLAFVEHLLGGEKTIFYDLSEGRVDFRELVRELAKEYKTRIEMKQIGVRDEARLVGDYEHCGQELCCRTFLKELEPVTMKMAKNQKTTMDPAKISGRCGRLMCCLKYEDDTYLALKNQLPKKSSRVQTIKGEGEVVDLDILAQQVIVELDSKEKIRIKREEIIKTVKESTLKVGEDD
jgi:cell fate regulator YaaT (PSP1 superfamily)